MTELHSVVFRAPWGKYNSGDVAGFTPEVVERLCDSVVVRYETDRDGLTQKREFPVAERLTPEQLGRLRAMPPSAPDRPRLISVQFNEAHGRYNAGDVAGFDPKTAAKLTRVRHSPAGKRPPIADLYVPEDAEPDGRTAELDSMEYRELQALAKELDVKASGKEDEVKARIREAWVERGMGNAAEDTG